MYTEEMVAKLIELAFLKGKEEAQREMSDSLDKIIGLYAPFYAHESQQDQRSIQ